MSSALENIKWKLKITLEVLNGVTAEFPETKEFIEERLEQKCAKENISVEEVTYIFGSLEAELQQKKHFLFYSLRFWSRNVLTIIAFN